MAAAGEKDPIIGLDGPRAVEDMAHQSEKPILPPPNSEEQYESDSHVTPIEKLVDAVPEAKTPEQDAGEEKPDEGGMADYFRIFTFCDRTEITLYVVAAIAAIISGVALPLMTIVFGQFTSEFNKYQAQNKVDPDGFRNIVKTSILYFVYLFIGKFLATYISNAAAAIAAVRVTRSIRKRFLNSTLRQEIWHYDKLSNGSISSQVVANGLRINQGLAEKLVLMVQGIAMFFAAFIVALAVQWKLALIVMSIIPAIFLSAIVCFTAEVKIENRIIRIYSRAAVLAQEAFSSIKTIQAFWAHDKMIRNYDTYLTDAHRIGKKKDLVLAVFLGSEYFFTLAGLALAFWEGFRLFQSGEVPDAGTVLTVVLSVTIGATSMSTIAPQMPFFAAAGSAAGELFAIIDKPSLLDPLSDQGEQPKTCAGNIEIRDLTFAYPTRPAAAVLHSLNLSVPAGKTTALVGASGCGKSTLIGLLERWYVPGSGEILLDGVDLSHYNTKWLRSRIRLVQQEPVLFRGTIFENVAQGLIDDQEDLTDEEKMSLVEAACRSSNAHDFIQELPEGYHTQVGERASMLSGGQKQRIAIARSIISNPQILLLDEATSALDPRAEGIVQDALNKAAVNKTTLVIAHKLATIQSADHIVVMAYGRVAEEGTHAELLALDGQYAALVRAQDLGGEKTESRDVEEEEQDAGDTEKPDDLERIKSLQKTQTVTSTTNEDGGTVKQIRGTLNYSLIRCIIIMLGEQKDLYVWLAGGFFASLICGGTFPAQALLEARLINVFILPPDEARDKANFYSLMLFIVAIANLLSYGAIGWISNHIAQTSTHRYRLELFNRLVQFDQEFFDTPENSTGALTSKLVSVPNSLMELLAANLFLIAIVLVNLIACSVLAIAYGWKLGLVIVFGGLPLLVLSGWGRVKMEQKFDKDSEDRFADSAGLATEAVTSIRTVASLTMERGILDEYNATLDHIVQDSIFSLAWSMVLYAFSQSLDFLIMALGFGYGSVLILDGEYNVQQFFVIFIAFVFGGQAAGQFFGYSSSLAKAGAAANYILWLRTQRAAISENDSNAGTGPDGDGPVEVQSLEFKYKQRKGPRVLKGIDLTIPTGAYVACVGPSGCGKSTLISLLERFYDPNAGRITLKDVDIASMSPRLYRSHMSLVQQEPTLYQGSVRENISLGLEHEPTDEQILDACRQANAFDFVTSLPEGLSTPCGSKGLQFSGGQRQRIAIARALIREPRLLLLDEATSALDTQSERIVQQTLNAAAAARTTVAVAHRLSTVRHADIIFVFADGHVVERGTHEELQRLRGRYYQMCLAQSLDRT